MPDDAGDPVLRAFALSILRRLGARGVSIFVLGDHGKLRHTTLWIDDEARDLGEALYARCQEVRHRWGFSFVGQVDQETGDLLRGRGMKPFDGGEDDEE